MIIITSLVLNRRYNASQVIFEYLKENIRSGGTKYIMYPRFIMMMINDQFNNIPKDNGDILDLRNMTSETIARLTKGTEEGAKRMICRINNSAYIAPENDRWTHENSSSDDEYERMSELVEKKTRWWFVRDGKRKRTPKTTPAVPIQKKSIPKIVLKGIVIDHNKGWWKRQTKRKAVQYGDLPRKVHARKGGASLAKDQEGKKEKHVATSKVQEGEKAQSVEVPVEPEVVVQKQTGVGDDYVEITGYKAATPPPPPPEDQPESTQPKDTSFADLFGELPHATGVYRDDIPDEDYDMFNNEAVKELTKKVAELEK
ncbi:hypothetical protein Hanom_Chr01g00046051 [Helianthus anomalus]